MSAAPTSNFGFNLLYFLVNLGGGETYFILTSHVVASRRPVPHSATTAALKRHQLSVTSSPAVQLDAQP